MTSYKPDPAGLAEIGLSAEMSAAMTAAARVGADVAAAADPRGRYTVEAVQVTEGRRNEQRAGAMIQDDGPDSMGREMLNRTLARTAVSAMEAGR